MQKISKYTHVYYMNVCTTRNMNLMTTKAAEV